MVMVKHSQGSATGKAFVWQFFTREQKLLFQSWAPGILYVFYKTHGYLCECRVGINTSFKRIFYFYITGDDSQRVPFGTWTLDPAPFISHACKTPPVFGAMKKCCAWEGEHSCVSGCALPGCFSTNNWAEECKWSLRRQPQAETQPFSPSGPTDVRHNVGTGCCISCIAKASPIYIYISLSFCSQLFVPPHSSFVSLCSAPLLSEKKITQGQRHEQCFCMCCWLLL